MKARAECGLTTAEYSVGTLGAVGIGLVIMRVLKPEIQVQFHRLMERCFGDLAGLLLDPSRWLW